jgi:small subunit ribosomal protein S2
MTEDKPAERPEENLLIPRDQYLAAGIHIGTQIKTLDMEPFIYRITKAGLYVIDIRKTDTRMRIAAKFIAKFDPTKIVVVSARRYGHNPIQQLARMIGANAIAGRFIPGSLTNPTAKSFLECDLLIITDPRADKQALKEAKIAKIPVVAFCDTDNNLASIDFCVPANNRGRKSLALIYWLIARTFMLEKGEIAKPEDFNMTIDHFQSKVRVLSETGGDQQKIMEQIKETELPPASTEEEGTEKEEKPEAPEPPEASKKPARRTLKKAAKKEVKEEEAAEEVIEEEEGEEEIEEEKESDSEPKK